MFDTYNQLTKVFRMARDRFKESDLHDVHIRLIGNRGKDVRQYNMPTTSEVAAVIVGDLSKTNVERDVIVEHISDGLQCISDLNPSFMAMEYPILFPYGEDGYHLGIPYKCNEGRRQTKRHCVTMREYYAYRIQQRENESQTIICGRLLFQQFLVDAYTTIEEERLRWIRNNQPQLRAELRPEIYGTDQDVMAICRWAGNPDLFITFTANPKWPEIQKFVNQIPGQKPNDRPDIESKVFKIKLDQLVRDLIKLQHFGRVIADKYPTPSEIDKNISAEIPDETSDYTTYVAVAEFMMHGPCGAANNKAPCKTYVYRTLIARLRSEGKIVLAIASSGIAALILQGGRTAHSRFEIPIILEENSTCGIHQGTQLAELIKQTSLIIWDEAPMHHRHAFKAVDKTLKDILRFDDCNSCEKPLRGKNCTSWWRFQTDSSRSSERRKT
ncbi:uncharacterized protein LOC143890990 [Tasmannia lanceolata]|uniref:uncharacterized protein LOC143890990 n=1 Tax=Tasmannia lanceolata TaxID=3420 RepID=UPI004064C116